MARRAETRVVNAAGAAQGVVPVTFPAASTIFTSPSQYHLSNTRYRRRRINRFADGWTEARELKARRSDRQAAIADSPNAAPQS